MKTVLRDTACTAARGAALLGAVVFALILGPRIELAVAPPVSLWEINNPRVEEGEVRWSVVVAQVRDCRAAVTWTIDGAAVSPSGPPFDFKRGEAAEIGTYRVTGQGRTLTARVIYNCGTPWGMAPIVKTALIQ